MVRLQHHMLSAAVLLTPMAPLVSACASDEGTSQGHLPAPGYYWQSDTSKGVIVFMHGVLGSARGTFTNQKTGAYWPELVKEDEEFDGFDIYVYQFPTTLLERSMSVDELSEDLRLELQNARVFDQREVIFVCHSMGGLIVRSFLQKYQSRASKVSFIYFFSTPTQGSEIARLAKWLSKNPQFGDMVPITDSNYLANQLRAWLAADFPIASYCAYEDKSTVGQQVVPMASAAALCNKPLTAILSDHMGIAKPKDRDDKPHRALQNAFRETRNRISFNFADGLTFEDAAQRVAKSDVGDQTRFEVIFHGCEKELREAVIRGGPINQATREEVIQALAERLIGGEIHATVLVTRDEKRGYYEVQCSERAIGTGDQW